MSSSTSVYENPLFHQEPAHPGVIKLHDDLVNIYKIIREAYQENINATFDRVSRQIGFVVMTTLPITLNITDKEANVALVSDNLQGTLFEEAFLKVLDGFPQRVQGKVATGSYKLYLIWYDALKLKLHTDWMEPAHLPWYETVQVAQRLREVQIAQIARRTPVIGPGVHEPAHWFDPAFSLETEEALAISAIDQVYPELRLVERVQAARQTARLAAISPGIREPAHYRQILERFDPQTLEKVVEVIQAIQQMR
jgi:hypothetical protein